MNETHCDYKRKGDNIFCRNCGRTFTDIRKVRAAICGEPLRPRDNRHLGDCTHFLDWTGEETEAKCGGCQSAKAMTALAECELFGVVTPISAAKDKSVRSCKGCDRYATSTSATTSTTPSLSRIAAAQPQKPN